MAKYNCLEITIENKEIIGFEDLADKQKKLLMNGNVIYLYKGMKSKKLYIGQTKHFLNRHKQHYSGSEEKFNNADFNKVLIVFSSLFNGSALDDVENQLITLFIADNSNSRKQVIEFDYDEVINKTIGNTVNDYIGREKIASEIIIPLWEDVLYKRGWVNNKTLKELRTKELVKYSPIKELTEQQMGIIDEIIRNTHKSFVINGDAGTGKTVLLTHLVAKLLNDRKDITIGVVVPPNWEKTAIDIFKVYGMDYSNLVIGTSSKLLKSGMNFDVIIVDEAHKLSRRGNKQMHEFNKVYEIKKFENELNHLDCLKKIGSQLILMYDILQGIRPAHISRNNFSKSTCDFEYRYLLTQFRIQAPEDKSYTSEDYINGIKYLLYKDTGLLEKTNFNPDFDRDVFNDTDEDAYFGYFDTNPLKNLIEWLESDKNYNPQHVNRILSGLVEPWKIKEGRDKTITHFHEEKIKRRWNSTQENWINSKDEDAEDQIGSVFAVQGIDLNKVGVLIGNDLDVIESKIEINHSNFHNVNGKFAEKDITPENEFEFKLFVLNIYYILLTRGIDGIRIGFWKNNSFKEYLEKTLNINK